jgi:hypothetical protein
MATLHHFPGFVLGVSNLGGFTVVPTNSAGIEENLRSRERREPRCLGKPLVPADEHTDCGIACHIALIAKVPRGKIKLFVIPRVVGDMQFAIGAKLCAIGVEHHGTVMVESPGTLLKQRHNKDNV